MAASISPITAFTLYMVKDGMGKSGVALLQHDLSAEEGQVQVGVGRPVSAAELMEALEGVTSSGSVDEWERGFVPKGVFYMTQRWVGWEVPARPALLRIKKEEIIAPLPRLLLFSDGEDLRVCAVRHRAKLGAETPVFHAPLLNVYQNGSVCWGSVRKPKSSSVREVDQKAWEAALIDSVGTHINHPHTLTLTGGGMDEVNTAQYVNFMLSVARQKQFPNRNLASMGMTLGQFVRSLG